ncbi:hypothetical protein RRG08_063950 [Elysia crispata]|uniref:Uncharacterized protein n=1 Tax=Elysia crispata TaxID=231223 RepID=A0AAE0YES2_9GAST|nr:hypothetical protein RRG08_063950 [Elysia crispata]
MTLKKRNSAKRAAKSNVHRLRSRLLSHVPLVAHVTQARHRTSSQWPLRAWQRDLLRARATARLHGSPTTRTASGMALALPERFRGSLPDRSRREQTTDRNTV